MIDTAKRADLIYLALSRFVETDLIALDTGARHPGRRELWRALKVAPLPMVKRYRRLCNALSRYRCA